MTDFSRIVSTKFLTHALVGVLLLGQFAGQSLAGTPAASAAGTSLLTPEARDQLRETAKQAFEAKEWQKTIDASTTLLNHRPGELKAMFWRGWAYAEVGQHDQALFEMTQATKLVPLNNVAWGVLCYAHLLAQQLPEAGKACDRALALSSDEFSLWATIRGHAWLLQGDHGNAWLSYEKAIPFLDDEADLTRLLEQFDRFMERGWQPQLVAEARRSFEVKGQAWLARKGPVDERLKQLHDDAEAAEKAKDLAKAIALREQRIPLLETLYVATHNDVGQAIEELARLKAKMGRVTEGEDLHKRRIHLLEKTLGPDHPGLADGLFRFAGFYFDDPQNPQAKPAKPLYRRALAIYEKAYGPEHPSMVPVLTKLFDVASHEMKSSTGGEYEALYKRLIPLKEKIGGLYQLDLMTDLQQLSGVYAYQGRYAEAELLIKRALAIAEYNSDGPDDRGVAQYVYWIGRFYREQGRHDQARPYYERLVEINKRGKGDEEDLRELAGYYVYLDRIDEAEALYQRALADVERDRGAEHPRVAIVLESFAKFYVRQKRYTDAEPLYKRALAIREKPAKDSRFFEAETLDNLAKLYVEQGRFADTEPLYRRVISLRENGLASAKGEHRKVLRQIILARDYKRLADMLNAQGRKAEAETVSLRRLDVLKEVLAMLDKAATPESFHFRSTLIEVVDAYDALGRFDEGLPYSRRLYATLKDRYALNVEAEEGEVAKAALLTEQKSERSFFAQHIQLLSRVGQPSAAAESFEAAQLAQASSVGQSVAKMAARFAATGGDLAKAIRQRQDTADRITSIDKALIDAAGQPPESRNLDKEALLRNTLSGLEREIKQQSQNIAQRFPQYDALVSPAPVAVGEVQKLLKADEALLFYLISDKTSHAWVVRQKAVSMIRLDIQSDALNKQVGTLRGKLDPEQNPDVAPFDAAASHALYRQIFAPLEGKLKGVRHIVLVSDGALQSLPFSVLVDKAPVSSGQTSWLADRYAFSVVPSVSSLRALRVFSRAKTGKEPFTGFGNPVLQGSPNQSRRVAARALFARGITTGDGVLKNGIADVEQIRKAAPLPETETELRAVAGALKAGPGSVRVGIDATETLVKQTDLTPYRVLAFSTHGVMAGELAGVAEPGLILTPPAEGTALDDGYLTASEVAQLKLNADWVILSACNTAAPDGKPGAEGLSGLAKGFFHAGARSLLVSNWYVDSNAATRLTTELFKRYAANPGRGKAEALSQAMQKLRQHPDFAHPLFWAPFSVVGEGG